MLCHFGEWFLKLGGKQSSTVMETKNKQHGRKCGDTYNHSGSGSCMDRKDSKPIRASVGRASVYSCGPVDVCC